MLVFLKINAYNMREIEKGEPRFRRIPAAKSH